SFPENHCYPSARLPRSVDEKLEPARPGRVHRKMQGLYDRQIQSLRDNGLWDGMEKEEQDFLAAGPTEISMQSYIDGNWLSESIVCLLWALGFVPNLPSYDEQVVGKGKTHLAKLPPKLLDEK